MQNKINYSAIITKKEIESLGENKINYLLLTAEQLTHIRKEKRYNCATFPNSYLSLTESYARETVFLGEYKYEDLITKMFLTAQIVYSNTEMIINILLSKNITYDKLNPIINNLSILKKLSLEKDSFDLEGNIEITDKNITSICKLINKYYECNKNPNIIINKLVEIVTLEEDLYKALQHNKTR